VAITERIRDAAAALDWNGGAISASIGIALYPADARDCLELIRLADRAMYAATTAGTNRVTLAGTRSAATPLGDDAGTNSASAKSAENRWA